MDFASDLSVFYSDFSVSVTWTPKGGGTSVTGKALHRQPGMTVIGGDVIATDHTLRYPIATFANVRKGDTFQIGALSFTVRENPILQPRGLEALVPLSRA